MRFRTLSCRILLILTLICPISSFATSQIDDFAQSWQHQALTLQRQMGHALPLGQTNFLTTHNSYNTQHYMSFMRYWDPNQYLSVAEQLDLGIRALEYDIHYFWNRFGIQDLLLCHGSSFGSLNHVGCSPFDRTAHNGLLELETWLRQPQNQQEVVILYIEDHMDDQYDLMQSILDDTIGDRIYRPEGCQSLPMNISKNDVLALGKQVIIIGGNCGSTGWSQTAFNYGYPTDNDNFLPYPACKTAKYSTSFIQNNLTRIYEDKTNLSRLFSTPSQAITPELMKQATACGLSTIGLDKLTPNDERLTAAIWSWDNNQPSSNNNQCALLNQNNRFDSVQCTNYQPYACRASDNGEWQITSNIGPFSEGQEVCESEFGDFFTFATPQNGYQQTQLTQTRTNSGYASTPWVNYAFDTTQGQWVSNNTPMPTYTTITSTPSEQLMNGHNFCLNVKNNDLSEGATIEQNSCLNNDSQQWQQDNGGKLQLAAQNTLCIGATRSLRPYRNMVLVACNSNQAITWIRGSNNSYRVSQDPSLTLGISGAFWGKGRQAKLYRYSGNKGQQWVSK